MVTLILAGTLAAALNVQPVHAAGTIYIRADGSIDPPTANITTADNVTYTFTGNNVADSLVVERDNIVLDGAGYELHGTGVLEARGIDLTGRTNVTVQHTTIRQFYWGISLSSSSHNTVSRNDVRDTYRDAIQLDFSSNFNIVSANTIVNNEAGLAVLASSSNHLSDNNITANLLWGIYLSFCTNISVVGNLLADNGCGIELALAGSSDIVIFHNSFIWNHSPASSGGALVYSWDDGYPSGGNYWNHIVDADIYKGSEQNETGSDGIWDHPYYPLLDEVNTDRYPLTTPFGWCPAGDVDGDQDVDIFDFVRMAGVYGVKYPNPRYDRQCDMDLNGDINLFDLVKAAVNYGQSW
jgi:parallel beta-helix repeat protein